MSTLATSGNHTVPGESPINQLSWVGAELFFQRGTPVNEGCTTYVIHGSLLKTIEIVCSEDRITTVAIMLDVGHLRWCERFIAARDKK